MENIVGQLHDVIVGTIKDAVVNTMNCNDLDPSTIEVGPTQQTMQVSMGV